MARKEIRPSLSGVLAFATLSLVGSGGSRSVAPKHIGWVRRYTTAEPRESENARETEHERESQKAALDKQKQSPPMQFQNPLFPTLTLNKIDITLLPHPNLFADRSDTRYLSPRERSQREEIDPAIG